MKKYFYLGIIVLAVLFTELSCSNDYDDSDIIDDIEDLESRVATLESLVSSLQGDISTLQTLVAALETGDWITSVSSFSDGYYITFNTYGTITIYNGSDGDDGYTPEISVRLIDGVYYWTLDGDLLTDSSGNPISVSPTDGGTGATPKLKIDDDGKWYYSVDDGNTWIYIADVNWGGSLSSNTIFSDLSMDEDYVYIYLTDGSSFTFALAKAFTITLSSYSVGVVAGGSASVEYTLEGSDGDTILRTYSQDNFVSTIIATDNVSGVIIIEAPTDVEVSDSTNVKFLMSDGDQRFTLANIAVVVID